MNSFLSQAPSTRQNSWLKVAGEWDTWASRWRLLRFTLSDCVYGHNIRVAGICLSAVRLLLYFLHSRSMLSEGASFLLWSRAGVRLLTAGFILVTSVFPCKGHKAHIKYFIFANTLKLSHNHCLLFTPWQGSCSSYGKSTWGELWNINKP